MGLRFDPIGGGQFQQALKKIIEAERQPIKQLEVRKGREEARMKLFQEFKAKFADFDKTLTDLTSYNKFKEFKVELGDGAGLVSVAVDKEKAQPGTYELEIAQLANRSAIISNGFSSPDEPILGVGYVVTYNSNGDAEEHYVGNDSASLQGIANILNKKTDGSTRATVIKDSSDPEEPWKLIVTSKKDGLDDEVYFPEFYFLDGEKDLWIDHDKDATNAVIKVDGFEIEADGNKIPDFLTGVSLELKQAKEGQTFTMTITEDFPKMADKMKGLVEKMNGILEFINKQNTIDDKSDTANTFAGDTSLQTIEFRLRNMMHEGLPIWDSEDQDEPRLKFMSDIGVTFAKNGKIEFSQEKFIKAAEKDPEGVAQAITGDYGFAAQMKEVMMNYTRPSEGLLAIRERGLRSRIKAVEQNIEYKERAVERRQEALTNQFARLQGTLGNLQQQQQYLQATLGGGGGGSPIAQLLSTMG